MSVFVLPLSRILLSLVFIFSGYTKVFGWGPGDKPIRNMEIWKKYVVGAPDQPGSGLKIPGTMDPLPYADLLAQIVAYGEFVGGILLFLGILSRLSAFGLFVLVVVASILAHNFWAMTDAQMVYDNILQFTKNMGIAAGLLMIVGMGGGAVGIDGMFRRQP